MQDILQDLASLARKILARLEYFLQDCFYYVKLFDKIHDANSLLERDLWLVF